MSELHTMVKCNKKNKTKKTFMDVAICIFQFQPPPSEGPNILPVYKQRHFKTCKH